MNSPGLSFGVAGRWYEGPGDDAIHPSAESLLMRIVEEFGREIGARERAFYGHATRVAHYAGGIAIGMDHDTAEIKTILTAAYVHDIGKLEIDQELLDKKGALTPAELEHLRAHASLGADLLEKFDVPPEIVAMVRHHHERFDGRGYPDGLSGELIPIGSRILLVADVFDALVDHRPYRPAWPAEAALAYLRSTAGEVGDPEVVSVFLEVARQLGFGLHPAEPEEFRHSIAAFGT